MTALAPRKSVPKLLIVLIGFCVLCLVAGVVLSVALYQVQNERIVNLKSIVTTTKTTDAKTYASLLDRYAGLYKQLTDKGIQPSQPAPSTIRTQRGITGATGAAGRGISSVACQSTGAWLVVFTDGSTETATGPCIGKDGQSITGAAGATGLPGQDGKDGQDGEPPVSWTYTDALGMQHTCQRDDPFDASAPTYNCD